MLAPNLARRRWDSPPSRPWPRPSTHGVEVLAGQPPAAMRHRTAGAPTRCRGSSHRGEPGLPSTIGDRADTRHGPATLHLRDRGRGFAGPAAGARWATRSRVGTWADAPWNPIDALATAIASGDGPAQHGHLDAPIEAGDGWPSYAADQLARDGPPRHRPLRRARHVHRRRVLMELLDRRPRTDHRCRRPPARRPRRQPRRVPGDLRRLARRASPRTTPRHDADWECC